MTNNLSTLLLSLLDPRTPTKNEDSILEELFIFDEVPKAILDALISYTDNKTVSFMHDILKTSILHLPHIFSSDDHAYLVCYGLIKNIISFPEAVSCLSSYPYSQRDNLSSATETWYQLADFITHEQQEGFDQTRWYEQFEEAAKKVMQQYK